ncbi:MAG: hypothetical protein FWC84_08010, partial [Alphaproteobacteria bacterium]|nr:hypothetical protein [Alphaproteobacteria bacterium]
MKLPIDAMNSTLYRTSKGLCEANLPDAVWLIVKSVVIFSMNNGVLNSLLLSNMEPAGLVDQHRPVSETTLVWKN